MMYKWFLNSSLRVLFYMLFGGLLFVFIVISEKLLFGLAIESQNMAFVAIAGAFVGLWLFFFNKIKNRRKGVDKELFNKQFADFEQKAYILRSSIVFVHESNNVLSIIRNYAQLMSLKSTDEKVLKYSNVIMSQSDRAVELNGSLRDFEGIAKDDCKSKPCQIADVIKDVVELFGKVLEEKNVKFIIEIEQNVLVLISKFHAEQLLFNLLKNVSSVISVKKNNTIEISLSATDTYAVVAVMLVENSSDVRSEVNLTNLQTELFSEKEIAGESLSIIRAILSKNGGRISNNGTWGKGDSMGFWLPIYNI